MISKVMSFWHPKWSPKWPKKWCHFGIQNNLKNDIILTSQMSSEMISFWSLPLDRIQLETASSRDFRKFWKNFKKPRASGPHLELIRPNVSTFWSFITSAYFLFHVILKNKKKKLEEIGIKWCPTFGANLPFILLKKVHFLKIAFLSRVKGKFGF